MGNWFKNYSGIIWLVIGILAGSIAGLLLGKKIEVIKPLGDIFLNLLFVAVIPLVFFAIASTIANLHGTQKLGRIMSTMALVFVGTVIVAALVTILAMWLFPVHPNFAVQPLSENLSRKPFSDQLTSLFTTDELY